MTSPHKERDGSVIGRKLLRFPTRDQAMKQLLIFNQYFQADVVKSLDNQQKYDILADDGKHYHALYHEVDGVPCLELPNWGPEGVIKGDLSQLCVARLGKYSAADGLNVDTNRYTAGKL